MICGILWSFVIQSYNARELKPTIRSYRNYQAGFRYLYSPPAGIFLLPLSLLRYKAAIWMWYAFSLLCLASIPFCVQYLRGKAFSRVEWGVIIILFTFFTPIFTNLRLGQINIVLATLFVAHIIAAKKQLYITAGLLLSILIIFKLFPAVLLLYYAIRRDWKMMTSTLIWCAFFAFAALQLFGMDDYIGFRGVVQNMATLGIDTFPRRLMTFDNSSVFGAMARLLGFLQPGQELHALPLIQRHVIDLIRLVISGLMGAALILLTWKQRKHPITLIAPMLWISLALLSAREIQTQYILFLLPVCIFLLPTLTDQTRRWRSCVLLIAILFLSFSYMRVLPDAIKFTTYTIVPFALIGHLLLSGTLLLERLRKTRLI